MTTPIADLHNALRSPASLVVGGVVGGAAPLCSYSTIHLGRLIEGGRVEWMSPLWVLVAGAFALSSKSVYRWGRHTFDDPWSAVALVAMLEGALLLSPLVPTLEVMGQVALGLLVAINVVVYGSALALKYQADKAAAAAAAVVPVAPEPLSEPVKALPAPKPVSSSNSSTPKKQPEAPEGDLYTRAAELVAKHSVVSTELVRTKLKVRQQTATELLRQLEADGVVGRPDPRDHHRRPVLLSVVPAE